ncbi:RIB43A-like with coiled-coils protein 2 [Pollicipes pollicipes]|uniref:RIB43A-like with coiled-coils protein 2 n=1 Tax=Pollicipes pollicipes TaxID=41117 RepID=UPI0018851080|nr:RIB43A-like with coiled-coils protein 2 [Pollicipes pollicipes]XP_037085709.1 RIB43A-like with coiled-coils protein 2 [Pollicipes pollicipes]
MVYGSYLAPEYRDFATIERRKRSEDLRKNAIFDSKKRTIGLDLPGINRQVQLKKEQRERDKQRDEAFERAVLKADYLAQLKERDECRLKRALNVEQNIFRSEYQRPEQEREFDLNDPKYVYKFNNFEKTTGPPDGPFALGKDERPMKIAHKKAEMEWEKQLRAQLSENKASKSQQEVADGVEVRRQRELNAKTIAAEKAEDECRKAVRKMTSEINQALAVEQKQTEAAQRQDEAEDNMAEIRNTLYGDFLTETPYVGISSLGSRRVQVDRYKGLLPEERARLKLEQHRQMEEDRRRHQLQQQEQQRWEEKVLAQARLGMLKDRQQGRAERQIREQMAKENRLLALEQEKKRQMFDKHVYTNVPSEAYFSQFNTSTR